MKKVIITGVSGFIGSNLARYLKESGEYEIIGIDRNDWNGGKLYKQDLMGPLPDIPGKIYAVIHLAARAGVRDSREKFSEYVRDNIIATHKILEKCIDSWDTDTILIASSSSVYDNKSGYSFTKKAVEDMVDFYMNAGLLDKKLVRLLRIFTAYGPGQRKGLAIGNFIKNVLEDKPITIYGDGTQSRDFVYIDDLCRAIEKIMVKPYRYDTIVPLGHGESHSINEVVHTIAELTGKQVTIKYEPFNRYDSMRTCCDEETIEQTITLKEGIKKQLEAIKNE